MTFQEGDVVRFDYVLWADDDKKPLETSIEDVAKQHGILHEGKVYRPLTVTLGRKQILPALEAHIQEHGEKGKELEVTLPAKDAYGDRDPAKIKDIPMAQFKKQRVKPEVGMELQIQGRPGRIVRVAGGRVRVDMNHALAGHDLRYVYTVRDVLTDEKDKVDAVLQTLFPHGGYTVDITDDAVSVEIPDQAKFAQDWMMGKFRLVGELRDATGRQKDIRLVETYPSFKEQETSEPAQQEASEPGQEDA